MTTSADYSTVVQQLYIAYFGRPADPSGLQNFEAALDAANAPTSIGGLASAYGTDPTVTSLIDGFGTSAESMRLYGPTTTTANATAFVNAVFGNLFDRAPAAQGLQFWVNALTSGSLSPGNAAIAIASGAYTAAQQTGSNQAYADTGSINNKVTAASEFTSMLSALAASSSYGGSAAAATVRSMIAGISSDQQTIPNTTALIKTLWSLSPGQTSTVYSLTTAQDHLQGGSGNNIFNAVLDNSAGTAAGAPGATLGSGDSITGAGQSDTLNILDYGTGSTTGSLPGTISGITALNLASNESIATASSNSIAATELDFSTWSGLNTINATAQSAIYLKAPQGATVNTFSQKGYTYIDGGHIVNVTGNGLNSVTGDQSTTTVSITGWQADVQDINAGTGKPNSITTVTLTNANSSEVNQIVSDALTTLTLNNCGSTEVDDTAANQSLNLTLNGNTQGTFTDSTVKTLSITALGQASPALYMNLAAATSIAFDVQAALLLDTYFDANLQARNVTSISVTGAGAFSADLTGLNAAASVNATKSTGTVAVTLGTHESFQGGSGQDIVTISGTPTAVLAAGSAANNEIVLDDFGATTSSLLADVSHFTALGVAGTTGGTFDMSSFAGYNSFDVESYSANATFVHAAANSALTIGARSTGYESTGNSVGAVTLQTSDANGAADHVALSLGSTTSGNTIVPQLVLEDSQGNGPGTLSIAVNENLNDYYPTNIAIGALTDNNLSALTLSGNSQLAISTPIADQARTVSINNSAGNAASVLAGLNDNNLTALNFSGSEPTTIQAVGSNATTLTIVDNDASAVNIGSFTGTALSSASFSISGAAAAALSLGTIVEPNLANLTLNGNVAVNIGTYANPITVSSGITVNGATDNERIEFFSSGATAAGKTDSITLGTGEDEVQLGAGVAGSTQTVTLGSGYGSLSSDSSGTVNITMGSTPEGGSIQGVAANHAAALNASFGNGSFEADDLADNAVITVTSGSGDLSVNAAGSNDRIKITSPAASVNVGYGPGASGAINLTSVASSSTGYSHSIAVGTIAAPGGSPDLSHLVAISGLVQGARDSLYFSGDQASASSVVEVTSANVTAFGGNTSSLASWVAACTGEGGIVPQAAHGVYWFQFNGNTYLVETVGATDAGAIHAGDTVVELTGTGYTFAHSDANSGYLTLRG